MASTLINKPTFLENKNYRFLIMDCPTNNNLSSYVEILRKKHVVAVVRACEATYSIQPLTDANIRVLDVPFSDGDPPPHEVVKQWLALVDSIFKEATEDAKPCIAVHCVAGLGRAPVLVAIALIESGMDPLDAIEFIRKKRRGAINARQLRYLEGYVRQNTETKSCCVIS